MLNYLLTHNREHAAELAELAHKLEHGGQTEAAALLRNSVKDLASGNEKLAQSIALL
jgi:hypothetical protein